MEEVKLTLIGFNTIHQKSHYEKQTNKKYQVKIMNF